VLVQGGVVVKAQSDSTGGTAGEVTNKMNEKLEVEFVAESPGGKQVPSKWIPNGEGVSNTEHKEIEEVLESSLAGGSFEHSAQALTTEQKSKVKGVKVEMRQCEKTIVC